MGINALLILGTGHLLGAVSAASLIHLIIDSIKYILLLQARKKNDGNLFIFDQGLHIIGLFLIAFIRRSSTTSFIQQESPLNF